MKRLHLILTILATTSLLIVAQASADHCASHAASADVAEKASTACTATITMGDCCVAAAEAGKSCCGKDAAALQASFDQAVSDAKAKQVSAAGGCSATCATACGSKTAATPTTGVAAANK